MRCPVQVFQFDGGFWTTCAEGWVNCQGPVAGWSFSRRRPFDRLDTVRSRGKIGRPAKGLQLNVPLVLILLVAANSCALAEINSGTIVVLAFTKSKAILIADGHAVTARHKAVDNKCKIAASSGRFLFSIAGVAGDEHWDAFATAKRIADTQLSVGQAGRSQMMSIVNAWSSETLAWWKTVPEMSVERAFSAHGERLMSALFCLRLEDNTILYYTVQVLIQDPQYRKFGVDIHEQHPPPNETFKIGAFGETDIADQLLRPMLPKKARLPLIRNELKQWKAMPENEETARFRARRIIDLTIANSRYGSLVGGDINHVELDRTGIHWLTDNDECRQ